MKVIWRGPYNLYFAFQVKLCAPEFSNRFLAAFESNDPEEKSNAFGGRLEQRNKVALLSLELGGIRE